MVGVRVRITTMIGLKARIRVRVRVRYMNRGRVRIRGLGSRSAFGCKALGLLVSVGGLVAVGVAITAMYSWLYPKRHLRVCEHGGCVES